MVFGITAVEGGKERAWLAPFQLQLMDIKIFFPAEFVI